MIPIPAPLEDVAVHIVQSPGVARIAADFGCATNRPTWLGTIVRLAFEVCLYAAELIAKRGGRRCPRPASVFPLRFGGQTELPILGKLAGAPPEFGEFPAKPFSLGKIDVANREVIPLGQFRC